MYQLKELNKGGDTFPGFLMFGLEHLKFLDRSVYASISPTYSDDGLHAPLKSGLQVPFSQRL